MTENKTSTLRESLWFDDEIGMSLSFIRTYSVLNTEGGTGSRSGTPCTSALPALADNVIVEAVERMEALERGEIANPDENRQVGHYWLRDPKRAPTTEVAAAVTEAVASVKRFASEVISGRITGPGGRRFTQFILVGIGGSALGPQFVSNALAEDGKGLKAFFLDNTDPDGMARLLARLSSTLEETLVIVISKSGGTPETRNGQRVLAQALQDHGLDFARQAVAVTSEGSALDREAVQSGWLARFPMWDWVGGRTSELSTVGLLPAALQGIDVDGILQGAREMDQRTRAYDRAANPALRLAEAWYRLGRGRGDRSMVVLPYKDRLELFSRYLQQLVMESLGKRLNLKGEEVHQGLSVFGNKGSTDQHAFVQQLRDGRNDFFAVFIDVLRDYSAGLQAGLQAGGREAGAPSAPSIEVEPGFTSGDFLTGFSLGTQAALAEAGRPSISIVIDQVNPKSVGALIALFERAVGFYATFIGINAYHQPGVEAGKKAAASLLGLQTKVREVVEGSSAPQTAEEIARTLHEDARLPEVLHLLRRLSATGRVRRHPGAALLDDRYSPIGPQ